MSHYTMQSMAGSLLAYSIVFNYGVCLQLVSSTFVQAVDLIYTLLLNLVHLAPAWKK